MCNVKLSSTPLSRWREKNQDTLYLNVLGRKVRDLSFLTIQTLRYKKKMQVARKTLNLQEFLTILDPLAD